jgi:hypothetical protein
VFLYDTIHDYCQYIHLAKEVIVTDDRPLVDVGIKITDLENVTDSHH